MKKKQALQLLKQTQETYNTIAHSYSQTKRPAIWSHIDEYTQYLQKHSRVLDVGCGDGRLAHLLQSYKVSYTGVDISKTFIDIAKSKHGHLGTFQRTNGIHLPFKQETFDHIFAIGVIHHIPGKELRKEWLEELRRVLKPNGHLTITAWANLKQQYRTQQIQNNLKILIRRTNLDWNSLWIPWKKDQETPQLRYYHIFTKRSLRNSLEKNGFLVRSTKYTVQNKTPGNILLHAQKPTTTIPIQDSQHQRKIVKQYKKEAQYAQATSKHSIDPPHFS